MTTAAPVAATNGASDAGPVSKYETEEGLKEVAAFLRGSNGMPLRPAIEMDKRVEYFKGERDLGFCAFLAEVCQLGWGSSFETWYYS